LDYPASPPEAAKKFDTLDPPIIIALGGAVLAPIGQTVNNRAVYEFAIMMPL
jgi:hypothetical protein